MKPEETTNPTILSRRCKKWFVVSVDSSDQDGMGRIAREQGGRDNDAAIFAPNMLALRGKTIKPTIIALWTGEAGGALTDKMAAIIEEARNEED